MCAQIIKILLWSGFEPPIKVLTPYSRLCRNDEMDYYKLWECRGFMIFKKM